MWRLQLSWDKPVPPEVAHQWHNFISEMQHVKQIKLTRRVTHDDAKSYQLIGFCDGSSKAYGCCVYLRTVRANHFNTHLLIAKSKVAPLKPLTVNRLELCVSF
ncbi:unnamed protein product [Parnassius mnemosyne]|uniref:Uncharacterized protein n=1 Tax=Parnassius mnemosyne TaxID=213953 RepID=A0AAV1M659_9NEOP